jgi:MATE family multidrug resistance protein
VNRQSPAQTDAGRGGLGELLRLAWPVVLSRLGIMAMGLTDAIVVGHHSSVELGYQALGWAPTMVVMTTAVGLLTGVQVLTAQLIGEERPEAAGTVLRRGTLFALVVGLVSGLALHAGAAPFMRAIGLEPSLAAGAAHVAQVLAWSMPTYLVSVALTFWLEALQKPVPAMIVMWSANVVNLAFNLWLVPGGSPFPVDGAAGSATATFMARSFLMLGLAAWILLWPRARQEYGLFKRAADAPNWRALTRIGTAAAGSLFVETSAFAGMNVVAGLLGAIQVAAWSVVLNVAAIVFMVPLGLASATAVLVGRGYGERSPSHVWTSGTLGFRVTAAALTVIAVGVWLGADVIVRAYTSDPALAALAAPALALSSLFFVADGLQVVAANALRARDDVWLPTLTHTISYALVMLPLGWVLAHPMKMGIAGIVWSVIGASILAAGFLLSRFWWLSRPGRSRLQAQAF